MDQAPAPTPVIDSSQGPSPIVPASNKKWLKIASVILILLGLTGIYAYQYFYPTTSQLPLNSRSASQSATSTDVRYSGWQELSSPEFKFSMKYPPGWISKSSKTDPGNSPGIFLFYSDSLTSPVAVDARGTNSYQDAIDFAKKGLDRISEKDILIGATKAHQISFVGNCEVRTIVNQNNKGFELQLLPDPGSSPSCKFTDLFDLMVQSVKFID